MSRLLLARVPIAVRLRGLSVSLILIIAASNLYLSGMLWWAADKTRDADMIVARIEAVHQVQAAINSLMYWRADLALSMLMNSQRNGDAVRDLVSRRLGEIAAFEPTAAAALRSDVADFDRLAMQAIEAYTVDRRVIGNTLFAQARVRGLTAIERMNVLETNLAGQEREARDAVISGEITARRISIAVVSLSVLFGVAVTVLVLRSILGPLRMLVEAIRRIGAGDVTSEPPVLHYTELGEMSRAVKMLREGLVERECLERASRHQREMLRQAIEAISEGFSLYDEDQRLVLCNSKFRSLYTGASDVLTEGATFRSILKAAVDRGIVTPGGLHAEEWIAGQLHGRATVAPAGERPGFGPSPMEGSFADTIECRFHDRWVMISEHATNQGGTVAIYTDITELKERNVELEHATQIKSMFLANMSHELRTPLNAIIGYSQLLLEEAEDAGSAELTADLKKIEMAGNHLLGLINSVLDLSKIEAGRMDAQIEAVNVPALVSDVRLMIAPMMTRNGNRLETECAADVAVIDTDQAKLRQSLLNLLSNAAKFTHQGTINLLVERSAPGQISFRVTDTGIGLTEAQIGTLFQPFSQADASTTRQYGGTGLGLAITRSLIRFLGGDVTVTSTPGVGSAFTIVLPDGGSPPDRGAAQGAVRAPPEGGDGPTILVVDDDPAAREIIGGHLARAGYRLLFAGSGTEALDVAHAKDPDLITLDVMMPDIDGWSVLHSLKQDPALAGIPVVMISATEQGSLGVELGAADGITKPIDRERLLRIIRDLGIGGTRETVLIVDDDPAMRDIARRTINQLGLDAACVTDGREAIDWLDDNPAPALILLDLLMPRMDGFAVLRQLREQPDRSAIPVVVVTAKHLDPAERQWLREQAQQVVTKGKSGYQTLAETVRGVLARE